MHTWLTRLAAMALVLSAALLPAPDAPPAEQGRLKVRQLFTFETQADADALKTDSQNFDIALSADNGVTEGATCARITFPALAEQYSEFTFGKSAIQDWADFDFVAIDVYSDEDFFIVFELWDADSKNYATRFTNESVTIHAGRQTLLIPINRPRRNSQEGHEWHEIEAKGKIDLAHLTKVKLFTPCEKDHPKVIWIDNIRLMQEDAAKPKLKIDLPAGALAVDFGPPGAVCPGFRNVTAATVDAACGLVNPANVTDGGEAWPDMLTGTFVIGEKLRFQAALPNGKYAVWLSAGKILDRQPHAAYLLKLNGNVLCDEHPTVDEYFSEKYYFRFLHTEFSRREHALWLTYIQAMFPQQRCEVEVKDGHLTLDAEGHFLSALIVLPADQAEAVKALDAQITQKRIAAFEKTYYAKPLPTPQKQPGDGEFVLWQPGRALKQADGVVKTTSLSVVAATTFPTAADRQAADLVGAGAQGQWVALNLALTPFVDIGTPTLELADLTGPGAIPAAAIQLYHQSYRYNGEAVTEMAVVPGGAVSGEANITQCFWLWFQVPADAKPGAYTATFRLRNAGVPKRPTAPVDIPVRFEVYPFSLEQKLPFAFGMYGWAPELPHLTGAALQTRDDAVNAWARSIGFTARVMGCARLETLTDHDVTLTFDDREIESAKRGGFGVVPQQHQVFEQLGLARAISRKRMPIPEGKKNAPVDATPGIEFTDPGFKALWLIAMRKLKQHLDTSGLPYYVLAVDEPREVPNPWNRNFADTSRYCDWMKEIGMPSFVNLLGDTGGSLDYTKMVEHMDLLSAHAGPVSAKSVEAARAQKKPLWWYNTGMDRFSWGFFNWRTGAAGRWEWHFCDAYGGGLHGYPGEEWYNPFTGSYAFTSLAPTAVHPAGMLWQSQFFQVAMGINDTAYIYTLEQAIARHRAAGTMAETVAQAQAFLDSIRPQIPLVPGVAGMADISAGALVGKGAQDDAMYRAGEWRAKIADFLKVLAATK